MKESIRPKHRIVQSLIRSRRIDPPEENEPFRRLVGASRQQLCPIFRGFRSDREDVGALVRELASTMDQPTPRPAVAQTGAKAFCDAEFIRKEEPRRLRWGVPLQRRMDRLAPRLARHQADEAFAALGTHLAGERSDLAEAHIKQCLFPLGSLQQWMSGAQLPIRETPPAAGEAEHCVQPKMRGRHLDKKKTSSGHEQILKVA